MLQEKLIKTTKIIYRALTKTDKPLAVMVSGGKDSSVLIHIIRILLPKEKYVLCYMDTSIAFPQSKRKIKAYCKKYGIDYIISTPKDHKGGFYKRLNQFRKIPNITYKWCCRDLKERPMNKKLRKEIGRPYVKVIGIRKKESNRRKRIYKNINSCMPEVKDPEEKNVTQIYPLFDWTNEEIYAYIESNNVEVIMQEFYDKYTVTGCYWCPFYTPEIYRLIQKDFPNIYNAIIRWEKKLNQPSIFKYRFLYEELEKE